MATITLRTDDAVDEALDALVGPHMTKSQVIRDAILSAYRAERRKQLRAEAETLRDDEADVTASRHLAAEMESVSAW